MIIKITELESIVEKALTKFGYTSQEIPLIKEVLLYAQLRGNNQGVVKLIGNGIPKREGSQNPKIVKETPVSARIDGNKTHAMIVMNMSTDIAISKAKESGVGFAGTFNTTESTGALGYYVNKIAQEGLIGMSYVGSPFQTTAPHGSNEALFCTNPMAYGIPTLTTPIIFDMSTSAMAYYGLIEAKTAGKLVPNDTGYDQNGNPTNNPAEIMSGALKTFGGYKGSGLALITQILGAAWVGADSFNDDSDNAGNLVIAIDPEILLSKDDFKKSVTEITSRVKSARKLPHVSEIFIPGERAHNFYTTVISAGEIEIEQNMYEELQKVVQN